MSAGGPEAIGEGREEAILYAEVPCFYAEVECAADPSLRGAPLVIGGDPSKRGKVASASREALSAGVELGMPMQEALGLCRDARYRKTDMKRYREVSGLLTVCLRRIVDALEPVGLGAAYIDLRGSRGAPEAIAERLVEQVDDELGLPLRVGIGPAKFLAQLAAEHTPGQPVHRVRAAGVADFLRPLPVGALPGAGPRTAGALEALGARTVGELLGLDPAVVEHELGNHGLALLELARGEDHSAVRVARHPGSISRELTVESGDVDRGALIDYLRRLAHALEMGLDRQGLRARRVAIKVRYRGHPTVTRSVTLGDPVFRAADIFDAAGPLLDRAETERRPIRALGITLAGLAEVGAPEQQLDLFQSRS